jgi:hypothetical protein
VTYDNDVSCLLRFLGYLKSHQQQVPTLELLACTDTAQWAEDYLDMLLAKDPPLKYSSCANYMSSLINAAGYAQTLVDDPPDDAELCNLRRQCEKEATQQRNYTRRPANWIEWVDVQKTRQAACKAYSDATVKTTAMLKEVLIIMFHSVTPPDRESC